jgi:tryptophan-rich sensory protein
LHIKSFDVQHQKWMSQVQKRKWGPISSVFFLIWVLEVLGDTCPHW